jgi:hypothetical protein
MNRVRSIIKWTLKAILWLVVVFVLIFIIIAGLIQIPAIQNKLIHFATSYVSNKTHTRVEIKNISISFPKSVVIKGLFLDDVQKDTLIYAGEAQINIALKDLLSSRINIKSFTLENVNLNIKRKATDSLFNYNFLLTAFSSPPTPGKAPPPTPSKWTFNIGNVSLKNIQLHYDDAYGGMKVAATLGNMALKMNAIDLDKSIYSMDKILIESMNASVQMNKPANTLAKGNVSISTSVLPKIMAHKIQINNSTLTYEDSQSRQFLSALINRFGLTDGSVDLQKEIVTLDKITLSKSIITYNTHDADPITNTKSVPAPTASNWKVSLKDIYLEDNTLAYKVGDKRRIKNVFDANNLNYKHLTLAAKNVYYSSDKTLASINTFSAIDQNNFAITQFETAFSMDQHSITAHKLKARTNNSFIDADLRLQYSSLNALKDSLPFIFMNLDIRNVSIRNSDILYFNPLLFKQPFFKKLANITTVSGMINGRVNNLKGKNLMIKTGTNTVLRTDFSIIGLPKVETAYYDFPNLKLITGKRDLVMMVDTLVPTAIEIPENMKLEGFFKGRIKSFETNIGLTSSFGDAHIIATIDQNENFKGNVKFSSFDLGRFLKDTALYGHVTMTAEANGHGLDTRTIKAKIKADVSQINLKKYNYKNLTVDGTINGEGFEGKINLKDPNAIVDFDGIVDLSPNREHYKFTMNVEGIDLQKLNLSKVDKRIGLIVVADLKGDALNKLTGNASISKIIIAQSDKKYFLDTLLLASINEPVKKVMKKSSALIDIKYTGTTSPADLSTELTQFINAYFPISDNTPVNKTTTPSNFSFEIQLRNNPIISQVLLPQLTVFEPGLISGSFDGSKKELKLNVGMNKIVYGTTEIDNLALDVSSNPTTLNYKLSSSNISNPQAKLDNFLFDGKVENKTIFANLSSIAANKNKKFQISSQITKDKGNYKFVLDPKDFYLMNNHCDISADNYIEFGGAGFLIHHFFISNAGSQINVASVHDKFNDDLNIAIKNFRLDDLSRIIEKDTSLVKGSVDGNVLLKRVNNAYGIIADAKISNLIVREVPIGDLTLKADNPTAQRFDIDLNLSGADNNLTAKGFYIPNGGPNSINIKTDIQSLSMKTVQAFSMGQITEASGKLTGNILVQGRTDAPGITGELAFNNVFIKPAVLNNLLELKNEKIQLKTDGLYFNNFTFLDADQHSAIIDGTVKMKQFSNFIYALHVNAKDFLLFNSTVKDNKEFFGRMIIDSKIDVIGPMSLPVINGRIKMKNGSNFTFAVPEDELTSDKGEDVVEFEDLSKQNSILSDSKKKIVEKSGFSGFDLSSIIEVDKLATLRLLMDPASTDSLVVRGEAALSLIIDKSGKMSLTGAYHLDQGSYLVSLESVIKKKFAINPGSTIIWNGDPLDANISIDATYTVEAAPYDLVATQMSALSDAEKGGYKQRYYFLILLKLRGEILHPVISFEIQLRPEDKGILGGAVNQKLSMLNDDASALNKQVFALLVLGRFVQENPFQTEASSTSTMVRSTVGTFLSAQLNKLSSKYVPGVDLNFDVQSYDDYQTGQAQGRTQVALGIKKQLFNERLSVQVGGTVDVEGEKAKQNSASSISSDVTVEYKLSEDGRFLIKGFRHNLYEDVIEGQLVETGAGIVYVRDFNKWRSFFKSSIRKPKVLTKTKSNETITTK